MMTSHSKNAKTHEIIIPVRILKINKTRCRSHGHTGQHTVEQAAAEGPMANGVLGRGAGITHCPWCFKKVYDEKDGQVCDDMSAVSEGVQAPELQRLLLCGEL